MKQSITLFCGGTSGEHNVSINSAKNVLAVIDHERYVVTPVIVTRDGRWQIPKENWNGDLSIWPLAEDTVTEYSALEGLLELQKWKLIDLAYILIHGGEGENGQLQGFFDLVGVPYTGSSQKAAAITMDKPRFQDVLTAHGIRTPQSMTVQWPLTENETIETITNRIESGFGFPCFVKPASGGSSVGTSPVETIEDLAKALELAGADDDRILIQELVSGDELSCGVLDVNGTPTPLLPTLIKPKDGVFFDYKAKYTPGASEEITPAPISAELTKEIQAKALLCHQLFECNGVSRTDFLLDSTRNNDIVILETNTVPGMTQTSLVPQGAAAIGISFAQTVQHIIESATKL